MSDCDIRACPLWAFRIGCSPRIAQRDGKLPPDHKLPSYGALKAIRLHCLECCSGNANEVRLCPSTQCPSWRSRFGVMPETARKRAWPVDRPPESTNSDASQDS